MPPTITVHTPTWNRASTLPRVWNSLQGQTFRDFEWIVGDDGSDDGTLELVEGWQDEASFDVVVHDPGRRVGKPALDNWALRDARGRFFLTADSDDAFEPHALERFLECWKSVPDDDRDHFVGIVARTKRPDGTPLERPFPSDTFDTNFVDLCYEHGFVADHWHFCRTEVLREYPFPEVDWFVPEGLVWDRIGKDYRVRCVNDLLKTVYYGSPNSISGVDEFRYSRGRAHALAQQLNDDELRDQILRDLGDWFHLHVTYGRYTAHTGRSILDAARNLDHAGSRLVCGLFSPLAKALAAKDRLQGRVELSTFPDEAKPAREARR